MPLSLIFSEENFRNLSFDTVNVASGEVKSGKKTGGNLTGRKLNKGYSNMASNLNIKTIFYTADGNKENIFTRKIYSHHIA